MIRFKLHSSKLAPYKKNNNAIVRKMLRINNNYLQLEGNAMFKEKISDFINELTKRNKHKKEINTLQLLLNKFESYIVKTAKLVAKKEVRYKSDWFTQAKRMLSTHIKIRNESQKRYSNDPSE